jgi:hypothetical protein
VLKHRRSSVHIAEAARTPTSMANSADGAMLLAEVGAWLEAHRRGDPGAIEMPTTPHCHL